MELPNITLIALTNRDFEGHKRAIDKSCEGIKWGGVKIIWDESITSIDDWNRKIVYDLTDYVDTEFCMLMHADGYVLHPETWRETFLEYDFIGAPWPLPSDDYSYRTASGELVRVGNSVSLRSKKLLDLPRKLNLEWKSYYGNTHEDGFLNVHNRDILKEHGVKFAPLEEAVYFSREHELPENQGINTFAFHEVG